MTFFESFSIFLDFRTPILRILSWSTRKKSPRYLWKMCWNSDQSHYILCHHGHHLHRLQIRNLHRLQMQDFCSFGFTLDWSILWRFRRNIRLKYKCPKGIYDLEKMFVLGTKNTYRTMYRMYLGQAHGKMYYFSVIYLHWKNYKNSIGYESFRKLLASCFKELSYL